MRGHHGHADAHRDFVARDQRGDEAPPVELPGLRHGQRGRHDDGAHMQQGTLVRVVIVGGIDQDAVGQRGEGGLRRSIRHADHASALRGWIKGGDVLRDTRLGGVLGPGADGAAHGIQHQPACLAHHGFGQILEAKSGDEFGNGASGHGVGLVSSGLVARCGREYAIPRASGAPSGQKRRLARWRVRARNGL